jgi:sulfite exporter TauE/SafE
VLAAIALALQHFHLLPRGLSVSDQMSYGLVFLIGVVASVSSCLAVTGGLLVALSAKYNEAHPHLSDRERLAPHIYFNIGRLLSYILLGGAIGALGSALTLSPAATGMLTLLASLIMILLGLSMLGLFPSLAAVLPTMPKTVSHRVHDAAAKETKSAAFLLGGATFFLPCGFTQALQLYVLSKGSFTTGALTMLAFAVGTMPALLSLSAISSFAKGAFQKHFLRFAGAAVILLGLLNIQYGLVLTGRDMNPSSAKDTTKSIVASDAGAQAGEQQSISMRVVGLEYQPNQFTVKQGVPVQWWIDGSQADGCGRVLVAPKLRIQKMLSANSTTLITFTPDKPGEYAFNCGMGMMTPGSKITVVPNDRG